ncbi:MAG TPA: hypothetical protein VNK41_08320, partial [Vicinamibacterales bacterium]|nr:hypothetical protein [Vicinamibacterales bacterium]
MRGNRNSMTQAAGRIVAALVMLLLASAFAFADPGHGRLSRDLREGLSKGRQKFNVIVQASDAAVEDAVAKYGVRVKKKLRKGAVVEATAEALEAMSRDGSFGHLSGDTYVRSMMAVAAEAIGADQAWAGVL